MSPLVGQVTLGVYAVLLAVGGVVGFLKAGSRASLLAGLVSSSAALACLAATALGHLAGFVAGLVLAGLLLGFFGARLVKTRKAMPAGMMTVVSFAVLAVLAALIFGSGG